MAALIKRSRYKVLSIDRISSLGNNERSFMQTIMQILKKEKKVFVNIVYRFLNEEYDRNISFEYNTQDSS